MPIETEPTTVKSIATDVASNEVVQGKAKEIVAEAVAEAYDPAIGMKKAVTSAAESIGSLAIAGVIIVLLSHKISIEPDVQNTIIVVVAGAVAAVVNAAQKFVINHLKTKAKASK